MPITGTQAVVQSSGISHPISLNYGSSAVAAAASPATQPLNCEIPYPSAAVIGGDAHYQHYYHHQHYPSSLLAVVGAAPSSQSHEDPDLGSRMTTDIPDWDVETPSKASGAILDNSHSMISPLAPTATQIPSTGSTGSGSSSNNDSPQQDLWWTERLAMEAQQEYPGELGKCFKW